MNASLRFVRAITLDAEGTLIHPYPSVGAVYAEVLARHGISVQPVVLEKSFRSAFTSARDTPRANLSEESEKEFCRGVVRQTVGRFCPHEILDTVFAELYESFSSAKRWKLAEDAIPTLKVLKDRGYRLAILTNWDRRLHHVLSETSLASLVDFCFISSEIGFEKPDRRIFSYVEEVLGLAPQEMLHVGDSIHIDGAGALNACWNFLLLRRGEHKEVDGYFTIPNLAGLLEVLPN